MTAKKNSNTIEARRAQAEQLHLQLADQVVRLADSDEWQRFLDFRASFHSYSLNNTLLIWAQKPEASRVAGYRQWENFGRHVRKGEKSIKIFGYSSRKITEQDEKAGEEKTTSRPYFPILSVFDISQTELDEGRIDEGAIAHKLTGADERGIYERVCTYLRGIGWSISRGDAGTANGYTTIDGTQQIVIDEDLEPAQAAKTALHEAAHALLHAEESVAEYVAHRGTKETEAESVAYVMAAMLGLDTSAYSVGYVAGWANANVAVIRESAANVLRAVAILSSALMDEELAA